MKNLFLIDGAGARKSDLLRWVMADNAHDVCYVRKATTRQRRPHEELDQPPSLDLEFIREAEFRAKQFEYTYQYGGARYGFARSSINAAILQSDNVFLIVRNISTIRRVADDYSFLNTVPTFIYTSASDLAATLNAAHASTDTITLKLERSELALQQYRLHHDEYCDVLISGFATDNFHTTMDRLVAKYSNKPRIDPYLIAVMMSFNPANKKLNDYYDAIVAGVRSVSPRFHCRRVDTTPGSPRIAAEFLSLVASARCTVVDLTENKPNVYYELGVIQASGKACIITAEEGTVPAFYPRERKILFYSSAPELRDRLCQELRGVLGATAVLEPWAVV